MSNPAKDIVDLAAALAVRDIKDLPGAWEYKLDETWYVAVNAHSTVHTVTPPGGMAVPVGPYEFAVWYNGWLAALFHPMAGGAFASGKGANTRTFHKAATAAIRKIKGG